MAIDVHKVTRTVLLRRSKTVHIDPTAGIKPIDQKEETLSEKPHRLIWSEASRDVDANLQLMYEEAQEAADKELPRFQLQYDQLDAEYSMIAAGISYMLEQQKRGRDITEAQPAEIMEIEYVDPSWGGATRHLRTHKVGSAMEAGMVFWARENRVDADFIGAALSAYPSSLMKQYADKAARTPYAMTIADVEELRRRVKALTQKMPFACMLRDCLSSASKPSDLTAADPIVEAVFRAYINTQMYLATDELRREVLQDLGLGHIAIHKVSDKGVPWDRYRRPGWQHD